MESILGERNNECTGCSACCNICPVSVISMKEDERGFLYPYIEQDKCIDCHKCVETCPVLNPPVKDNFDMKCYAVMASDEIRYQSSSGGLFFVIGKKIIEEGGIVVGVTLGKDLKVYHKCVDSVEKLKELQKSKYVQSAIGAIYCEVSTLLGAGRKVFFTGTPCQIAGLYAYLGKKYENLLTADNLCHGVPSHKMLIDSLSSFDIENIESIDFRDKSIGWDSTHLKITYKDHSIRRLSIDESRYEQGFHYNLTLRDSCYDCPFCEIPHVSDISIGDFWRVDLFDQTLDDRKGTSLLLINTDKGLKYIDQVKENFVTVQEVPLKYIENNRIHVNTNKHPYRDYFLRLYPQRDFDTAVLYASQKLFDVGLVGNWSYPNYGSELTYYALFSYVQSLGLSVEMISWPRSAKWKPYEKPQLFASSPYESYQIEKIPETREEMRQFNKNCKTFLVGSDQLFNNNLYNWFDKFMQLDWVQNNKRKIAYAASFGTDYIWGSDDDRAELSYFIQKFDSFSVRENSGVDIAKRYYGVNADQVIEPVFLQDKSFYEKLMQKYRDTSDEYIFCYTLNPTKEKAEALLYAGKKLHLKLKAAGDAALEERKTQNNWGLITEYGLSVEEWLSKIHACKFMITDSFHGMCFAIIFQKPFIVISNSERGATRFKSLLEQLGLTDRMISSEIELYNKIDLLNEKISYDEVNKKLNQIIDYGKNWLKRALFKEQSEKSLDGYDLTRIDLDQLYKKFQALDEHQHIQDERLHSLVKKVEDYRITAREQYLAQHKEATDNVIMLRDQVADLRDQIGYLNKKLDEIYHSRSFKLGRMITWLPRKVVRFIRKFM